MKTSWLFSCACNFGDDPGNSPGELPCVSFRKLCSFDGLSLVLDTTFKDLMFMLMIAVPTMKAGIQRV